MANYAMEYARSAQVPKKNIESHYGFFIGRSNWQRLLLGSHLYNHYKSKTVMTYHYDSAIDYHRPHAAVDQLIGNLGIDQSLNEVSNFLQQLPIKQDIIQQYPIIKSSCYGVTPLYTKFFLELVCETFSTGKTFFPTEKTWRPMICKTPFMVQGPIDHLKNLRRLGFKTFDSWWDESYDEDGGLTAIDCIKRNLLQLNNLSVDQLKLMYQDMLPTLDHNREVFMSLSSQRFKKVFL
jgi:hypothetical protein